MMKFELNLNLGELALFLLSKRSQNLKESFLAQLLTDAIFQQLYSQFPPSIERELLASLLNDEDTSSKDLRELTLSALKSFHGNTEASLDLEKCENLLDAKDFEQEILNGFENWLLNTPSNPKLTANELTYLLTTQTFSKEFNLRLNQIVSFALDQKVKSHIDGPLDVRFLEILNSFLKRKHDK